jgi:fucose 4-O-acetylase-like acetyltransferase
MGEFIKNKTKSLYVPMLIYVFISLLLYPILLALGVIAPCEKSFFIKSIIKTCAFKPSGILMGAMWFVTFFFLVNLFYNVLHKVAQSRIRRVIIMLLAIVGILLIQADNIVNKIFIIELLEKYSVQRALIALPFMELGAYSREKNLHSHIHIWIWIPMSIIILLSNYFTGRQIDISSNIIYGGFSFFPITIIGIIFCISLAKFIIFCSNEIIVIAFQIMGQQSFDIMALHFIIFKIIDGIVGKMNLFHTSSQQLLLFPYSFPKLWLVYTILGIIIPIGIKKLKKLLGAFYMQKFSK